MPGTQMGRAASPVLRQAGRHLCDLHLHQRRFYYHLTGKFHARGTQLHAVICGLAKTPHSAMKIAAWGAEEETTDRGEHRITEIAVQWWHCMPFDLS